MKKSFLMGTLSTLTTGFSLELMSRTLRTKESGHSGLNTEPVQEDILSELIDTSKALQETIRICTDKKIRIDKLIMQIQAEKEAMAEENAEDEEEDPTDKGKGVLEGGLMTWGYSIFFESFTCF